MYYKGKEMYFDEAVKLLHSNTLTEKEEEDLRFGLVNSNERCGYCGAKVSDGTVSGVCPWCGNSNW